MVVNVVNGHATRSPETAELAHRLRPVLLKLARELRREVHALGVTGGQVALLIQIRKHQGDRRARARRAASASRPPAMSGYIERLQKAGLVTRVPDERTGAGRCSR